MITEADFIEVWRALFVATPVFVTAMLILGAYWNWGIPRPIIIKVRKAKKTSFWVWAIIRIMEVGRAVLSWIFSSKPIQLLYRIPGKIWKVGDAIFNKIKNNTIKIGVILGMVSVGLEFTHRQLELMDNIGRYATDRFTADPYARYVALLGILFCVYGYWREEVRD